MSGVVEVLEDLGRVPKTSRRKLRVRCSLCLACYFVTSTLLTVSRRKGCQSCAHLGNTARKKRP